ncbi:MAG TPA: adenylate/guanylate cyclase domain-containing protein [Bacteroidia bacterium]|nr:adenylate/guanylate cyclase domain-containing protein [Bacteroidia bacterium]
MALTVSTKSKLKTVLLVTASGIVIGPLFVAIAFGNDIERIIKGAIGGFLITSISSIFEIFVFTDKFKKLNFSILLAVKSLFYMLLISYSVLLVWVAHESMINHTSWITTMKSSDFAKFIRGDFMFILFFSIIVSLLLNFSVQVNNLLGKGVLLNYIVGKYHKPVVEERIFMFLDLAASTTIAEKIGPLAYHRFMNSYFFDINDPIVESKGEIYQYVGDEVVVSWKKKNGIKNAVCIECFFMICRRMESLKENYIKEFGMVPGFKAGMHVGEAVIGEVGDSKKEIVFHGDVLNTTSRIQAQAKTLNKLLLISEDLFLALTSAGQLDSKYQLEFLGKTKLKGKENESGIYSVNILI